MAWGLKKRLSSAHNHRWIKARRGYYRYIPHLIALRKALTLAQLGYFVAISKYFGFQNILNFRFDKW
jgi:hypothetical protein